MHYKNNKKTFALLSLLLILGVLALYLYTKLIVSNPPKLSLIVISIDSLRKDHMGLYGYPRNVSPNIDAWSKNAAVLDNYYTLVPMTYPSLAITMTGKDPLKTRIFRNRGILINDNNETLATILKNNGYKTVSYLTGALSEPFTKLNQGFENQNYQTYKYYKIENGSEVYYHESRNDYESYLDRAENWLEKNKDKKFFMWIHLMDPHAPYTVPQSNLCAVDGEKCLVLEGIDPHQLELERSSNQMCRQTIPQDVLERQMLLYDGGINYTDKLAGKFLNKISDLGLDKNSIIVITSDHGEGFDHNYFFNHRGVLYQSAINIPLIIKHPEIKSMKKLENFASVLDFAPTILDLLGIDKKPYSFDGQSFISALTNRPFINLFNQSAPKGVVFVNSFGNKFALIEDEYKYILSFPNSCRLNGAIEELYNLQKDPNELNNLAEANDELTQKLRLKLSKKLGEYNLPVVWAPSNQAAPYQAPESTSGAAIKPLPY